MVVLWLFGYCLQTGGFRKRAAVAFARANRRVVVAAVLSVRKSDPRPRTSTLDLDARAVRAKERRPRRYAEQDVVLSGRREKSSDASRAREAPAVVARSRGAAARSVEIKELLAK